MSMIWAESLRLFNEGDNLACSLQQKSFSHLWLKYRARSPAMRYEGAAAVLSPTGFSGFKWSKQVQAFELGGGYKF
jgi:hypothetical protein